MLGAAVEVPLEPGAADCEAGAELAGALDGAAACELAGALDVLEDVLAGALVDDVLGALLVMTSDDAEDPVETDRGTAAPPEPAACVVACA